MAVLGRVWQTVMIRTARSPRLKTFIQTSRATSFLAKKFVGGIDANTGVLCALDLLENHGIRSSLFYLGEYVDDEQLVLENVKNKISVAAELKKAELDVHISIDPTQIGHSLDASMARKNACLIAQAVREATGDYEGVHCLMFDMEDASVIDATVSLHNELQRHGFPAALTLQAYLRRTADDMRAQVRQGSRVRLVKGAFAAGSDIAFTRRAAIKQNMRDLIGIMFSDEARANGFYPIVATHDEEMQAYAITAAARNKWEPGQYEFEMLLGVRSELARKLSENGQRIRLYVPFGRDWWPYAVRRIGENPANAVLLARSFFS